MSLYRQTGGRGPAALIAILVAGLAVGGAIGFLAGRGSVGDPTLAELAAGARAGLEPVAAGIELVPIEYEGAVSDGEVTAPTEYAAARDAVARAEDSLDASAELGAVDPRGYEAATRALAALAAAIDSTAPLARVERLATVAGTRLEALAAGRAAAG